MSTTHYELRDVMQVCRTGHVITDLFRTFPERALSHCDRCGATTMTRCTTCGQELAGAIYVAESFPIGEPKPPQFCSGCGAAFPWTKKAETRSSAHALGELRTLLHRLPAVARQLRSRYFDRAPFAVQDEHDLEDLVRAVLSLRFDDIRLESRTPKYAAGTRTDFRLYPSGIAITLKKASVSQREADLTEQIQEDIAYYQNCRCKTLVPFVYDPERLLADPDRLAIQWASLADGVLVEAVVATS
jgi:hypothetical protein